MLTTLSDSKIPAWRIIQRQQINHVSQLIEFLELTSEQQEQILIHPKFPILVPRRLANKMKKGTLNDPIVRQFLPLKEELTLKAEFVEDPVADATFRKTSKLIQKYDGRCLIVCTGACAMHCRYCFRQNFNYAGEEQGFEQEIKLIREDTSLQEVILSGGDPLSLSNKTLEKLLFDLNDISSIKRIRFHTRFPIGIPERIDSEFIGILSKLNKMIYFVIHCNHVNELDDAIFEVLDQLRNSGCILLNQSVLLKGVNDTSQALIELCQCLVDHGILPYYLHQLDPVSGAAHFEIEKSRGLSLIEEIEKVLPGYAVPKYVAEIAGKSSKTRL